MESNFKQNIESMFERFEKFLKEKTVIGEPMQMGNVTMIPAVTVSFGMGNGIAEGSEKKGNGGIGSGGGFGARITPTAIIVVKGDDVQVFPISKGHAFEKLVDMVPNLMDKIYMKNKKEDRSSEE